MEPLSFAIVAVAFLAASAMAFRAYTLHLAHHASQLLSNAQADALRKQCMDSDRKLAASIEDTQAKVQDFQDRLINVENRG